MRKIAIALLATTVIGSPAIAASYNQQQPQNQQSQTRNQSNRGMSSQASTQNKPNDQAATQNKSNNKAAMQNQNNQPMQKNKKSAQNNQPISPQNLSRGDIREVQQALDKDGFKVGPTDGRWGPETRSAVKQFQQSKQIQANGKLDRQTVADLGLDASKFSQSGNQQ